MSDQSTLDLDALLEQERQLQFTKFDNDVAWRLGSRLVAAAKDQGLPVTIDITRGSQQLFHAALQGTSADNDDWIRRKCRAVYRFGHSSYYLGRTYTDRGARFEDEPHWDHLVHAAHGGAFPVLVRGAGLIGTIAVSGLPQARDHELVVTVLEEFLDAETA
ncbi:MAG: heme-degrading domain-containing protein [Actinomycetota bacterium]